MTSPTMRLASGCGSNTSTSMPASRKRAIHPPPMTPPPIQAALLIPVMPSSALRQFEFLADVFRADDPGAHAFDHLHGLFDELRIGGELAFADEEVVLEADAHVAAGENCRRRIGHGVAADRKGREGPALRHVIDHRHESV